MATPSLNSSVSFSVVYDGEAIAEHSMDVRDLAPALLALGEVFETANGIFNGNRTSVQLSISATSPGSFDIRLILTQAYIYSIHVLSGDLVTSAANLQELLIGAASSGIGLVRFLKHLHGQKPDKTRTPENLIRLQAPGIDFTVTEEVDRLYEDPRIRRLMSAIVAPLNKIGIDTLEFREGTNSLDVVEKSDLPAFDFLPDDAERDETVILNQQLTIHSPNLFSPDAPWRMHDGNASSFYYILDDAFKDQVFQQHRPISVGDFLYCDVRLVHTVSVDRRMSKRSEILRVLRYVSVGGEIDMFDGANQEDAPP